MLKRGSQFAESPTSPGHGARDAEPLFRGEPEIFSANFFSFQDFARKFFRLKILGGFTPIYDTQLQLNQ
jgi:hypothetical protein